LVASLLALVAITTIAGAVFGGESAASLVTPIQKALPIETNTTLLFGDNDA